MTAAVVTGSDSGIGEAAAVALAEAGFDVGVTYHADEAGARGTAERVRAAGRRAEVRRLDQGDPEQARATLRELAGTLGGLDAFVANAGIGHSAGFLDHSLEDWRRVIDVNLTGTYVCCQEAARLMTSAHVPGRIVVVTSVHEHVPLPGSSAYGASKGGLGLLVKTMALELAEHGVRVNAVAPGEIATAMTGNEDVDPRDVDRSMIPLGRPGDANEIGAFIAFLCGPGSGYATGASFVLDGGMVLMPAAANMLANR